MAVGPTSTTDNKIVRVWGLRTTWEEWAGMTAWKLGLVINVVLDAEGGGAVLPKRFCCARPSQPP